MSQPHTVRLSSWARLVLLSLLLGVGLLASLGLATRTAHAQPAATLTVTDCGGETGPGRIGTVISSASAGDTIMFSCSGTIPISSTLTISTNHLTLDGSGQKVTLDGHNSVQVLSVSSGVSFALNALTIANGNAASSPSGFDDGGGIFNSGGTVNLTNSTLSNNTASYGGGIANSGTVSISSSTFSGNSALTGAGGGINNVGTVNIGGSIVAANTGGNCDSPVTDQGYNLSSDNSCGFTGTGSLQNTAPKLDPNGLQSNGGPTQTIALQSGSPAIDHIPAASCPATDQRGVSRLPGEHCDIGAFEFPDTTAPTLSLPGTIIVGADSSGVAVVTYTATATDDDGDPLAATCAPASGSTFSIGTTTVNCSASEPGSNTASGSFQVVVQDVTPPVLSLPANIAVNATSPQGATVNYTVTATDPDNTASDLTISCSPASGSTFPIGTTTVNCSASDPSGNTASGSFQVVVQDVTAPTLQLPATITTSATSASGTTVTYSVTATDPDNTANQLMISCTPSSGSTFPIGTTTVNCSASDPAGNTTTGSFQVVVKGAAAQVNDLISLVNSFHLSSSLQTALDNKLQDVLVAIKAGQTATACSELTDFIGHVQSESGKGLTTSQANQLIKAARQVQAVLGC